MSKKYLQKIAVICVLTLTTGLFSTNTSATKVPQNSTTADHVYELVPACYPHMRAQVKKYPNYYGITSYRCSPVSYGYSVITHYTYLAHWESGCESCLQEINLCTENLAICNSDLNNYDLKLSTKISEISSAHSNIDNCLKEKEISKHKIASHNLFLRSAINGVLYSLVPEIVSDGVGYFSGSQRASNIASMLTQAGLVFYTAYDYAPVMTGTAVRMGCNWVGVPPRVSAIAGTTAAVVTSIVRAGMDFDQETLVDCGISMVGSFVGSTWALHNKDWVYSFWKKTPQQLQKEETERLKVFRLQIEEPFYKEKKELEDQCREEERTKKERQELIRQKNINNAKNDVIPDTDELYNEMISNLVLKRSVSTSDNSVDDLINF